jgi:hypothetical protein
MKTKHNPTALECTRTYLPTYHVSPTLIRPNPTSRHTAKISKLRGVEWTDGGVHRMRMHAHASYSTAPSPPRRILLTHTNIREPMNRLRVSDAAPQSLSSAVLGNCLSNSFFSRIFDFAMRQRAWGSA